MRFSIFVLAALTSSHVLASSLTLAEVYQLALSNDPALSSEIAIRDAATAREDQARARLGLNIDASATAQVSDSSETDSVTTGNLALTLSLPLFDRENNARVEVQEAEVNGAEAALASYRQMHIVSVTEAYFDVLSAEQDLLAAQAEVAALERQLEQATERLVVGIGTRVDVDQARARLDLAQVSVISSEVSLETARSGLSQLIGRPVGDLADLTVNFSVTVHRSVQNEIDQWVESHPKVISGKEGLASAYASLDQARAASMPNISLSSRLSVSDTAGSANSDGTLRSNSVSVTVAAPLFTNGARDADVAVAMAGIRQAHAELEAVKRSVRSDILLDHRALEASARAVEARQLAIVSAASRLEATEAAYAVGAGDIVEVLNAQKDLIAAERDFAKARHTHVIRQLEFDQAMGDLSESAIARINDTLQ